MGLNLLATDREEHQKNNEVLIYKDQIFTLFKGKFQEELNKGKSVVYQDLAQMTLNQIGIMQYELLDLEFLKVWFDKINTISYLQKAITDQNISEIILHNNQSYQTESAEGLQINKLKSLNNDDFQLSLEVLAQKNHIAWNYAQPFASFFTCLYNNAFRATLIHYSTSPNMQSKLFLRRIKAGYFPLSSFNISQQNEQFILSLIKNKQNVIVSGPTGSGKTSLANTMINLIPSNEHIVILEDTHEIYCQYPSRTYLLSDEEREKKTLKDYCAYALRMRPDRIIIGEMRSREVVPFILAMNTGHRGLISTIHANSAYEAINRLAVLFSLYSDSNDISYQLILKLICSNVNFIIHMKSKKIFEIIKILGSEGDNPFYEYIYENI